MLGFFEIFRAGKNPPLLLSAESYPLLSFLTSPTAAFPTVPYRADSAGSSRAVLELGLAEIATAAMGEIMCSPTLPDPPWGVGVGKGELAPTPLITTVAIPAEPSPVAALLGWAGSALKLPPTFGDSRESRSGEKGWGEDATLSMEEKGEILACCGDFHKGFLGMAQSKAGAIMLLHSSMRPCLFPP